MSRDLAEVSGDENSFSGERLEVLGEGILVSGDRLKVTREEDSLSSRQTVP